MTDFFFILKKVPLFADLTDADLEQLCRAVEEIHLKAGETLYTEGSPGQKAYVIKEGEIEIFKNMEDRNVQLAVRTPGEVIGEAVAKLESGWPKRFKFVPTAVLNPDKPKPFTALALVTLPAKLLPMVPPPPL